MSPRLMKKLRHTGAMCYIRDYAVICLCILSITRPGMLTTRPPHLHTLYHIISYILYHIMSHVSCLMSHVSCLISHVSSHLISSHLISSHLISYIISYHISYHIIYHIISYHIISYHIILYLTNKEAPTVLCSVVKHAGSG